MKKARNFFFIFFLGCWCYGYAQVKEFTSKGIEKEIVKVNDTLYAFRCETSNLEYNTFLNALAKKDSALYVKYSIDSTKWLEKDNNESLAKYYHRHPDFNNYPVLCMSYEGATAYCKWLTDIYSNDPERKFKKIVFVLPSEQEWELAALGNRKNITYPWGTHSLRETRKGAWQGSFLANYRHVGDGSIVSDKNGKPVLIRQKTEVEVSGLNDRAFYTAEVKAFYPNSIGIYNQSGNAAEMTIQKGLTKGGSWKSYGGEITIAYKLYFYEPSTEVGFRVFMKVIEP
jgi:sulfatase modifying factor 1